MEGNLSYTGVSRRTSGDGTSPSDAATDPAKGLGDTLHMDALHDALISIRRILRATELHGKELRAATNLKTSQLMVLQALEDDDDMTVGAITDQVRMAQASVTAIVVKLEQMGMVVRARGTTDKRKVFVRLTKLGHSVLEESPEALHRRFAQQFEPLQAWEQTVIVSALQRVATMMNAPELDAAPVLDFEHHDNPDQADHADKA